MAVGKEGLKDVTYGVVEENDYKTISFMTEPEGWNTSADDVKYLSSFQPSAAKVVRFGDKLLGSYNSDITTQVFYHRIIISSVETKTSGQSNEKKKIFNS